MLSWLSAQGQLALPLRLQRRSRQAQFSPTSREPSRCRAAAVPPAMAARAAVAEEGSSIASSNASGRGGEKLPNRPRATAERRVGHKCISPRAIR